jgi:hypothetical protein
MIGPCATAAPTVPPFVAAEALVVRVAELLVAVPIPPVKAFEVPKLKLTPPATEANSSSVRSINLDISAFPPHY